MSLHEFNNTPQGQQPISACLNIMSQITSTDGSTVYPLLFETIGGNRMALAGLSDYSMMLVDLETMKPVVHIPEAHKKRINGIFIGDNNCYSCSNDGLVKVWDLKARNPLMTKYKAQGNNEVYSVAQTKHVLGGGSKGEIYFWDLRNGKPLMTFNETHPDDVSSIEFFKTKSSLLLSASVDGMLCLFDLKQENEEEAAETVMVLEQPINVARFFEGDTSAAYALTTAQTIVIVSLAEAKIAKTVYAIEHVDTNEYSLLDAYTRANDPLLYYLRSNLQGHVEEYSVRFIDGDETTSINKYFTGHNGPITTAKKLGDAYILTGGEDGTIRITERMQPPSMFDFESIKKEMFIENEGSDDFQFNHLNKKKKKNLAEFNPFN